MKIHMKTILKREFLKKMKITNGRNGMMITLFDGGGIARKLTQNLGLEFDAHVHAEKESALRRVVADEYGYSAGVE